MLKTKLKFNVQIVWCLRNIRNNALQLSLRRFISPESCCESSNAKWAN